MGKCSKEVATAIRGAIILAKLSVIPVRRGYWGNKIGKPHTVPCEVSGKVGSVYVQLIPAPRGTGHLPEDRPLHWVTSLKQHMLLSVRPTLSSHLIYGRRQCSLRRHLRSLLITWLNITAHSASAQLHKLNKHTHK